MSVFAGRYFGIADREYCCVFLMADFQLNVELYLRLFLILLGLNSKGQRKVGVRRQRIASEDNILIQLNLLNRIL
ncbi:MAG: hypothetical protein QF779_03905 [SAR324 cluster bacterium]|jgi:hypothetical protein|nr:hypothetical protein [SAR324 cluster bacterium]